MLSHHFFNSAIGNDPPQRNQRVTEIGDPGRMNAKPTASTYKPIDPKPRFSSPIAIRNSDC
jgi:hypothetical protein